MCNNTMEAAQFRTKARLESSPEYRLVEKYIRSNRTRKTAIPVVKRRSSVP